jgi:predicted house-cleaning noncanonical NTP pyrophosphatase (MazG superfamily)
MRSPRETIIYCLERLIAQGGCSYTLEEGAPYCKYRSIIDGQPRGCAAGIFIKDEDYKIEMEGKLIEELGITFQNDNIEVLIKLQFLHDNIVLLGKEVERLQYALDKVKNHDGEIPIDEIRSYLWRN